VAWAAGCSNSDDPVEVVGDRNFDAVLDATGGFEEVKEVYVEEKEEPALDRINGQDYYCTKTHYDINHMPDDYPLHNPNAGAIWPGNLVQGKSLPDANPQSVVVARGGGDITMTILNGSSDVSIHVDEVTLGNVMQAQNDIIAAAANTVPAVFTFKSEEVTSKDQLAMHLGVEVGNFFQNFQSSLDVNWAESYNRYMVKLTQQFFTMVYSPPTTTAGFFGANVTADDLKRFTGPGNPPCYVSQVTYGRIFYMVVESTSSMLDIKAAIKYSCEAAVADVAMEAGVQSISELAEVNVEAFALGGDSSLALDAVTGNFENLRKFLSHGGGIDTGVAISYVVCDVANPSRVVNMAVAANYDVVKCVSVGESFERPIFWFRPADDRVDRDGNGHITEWRDFIGDGAARPDQDYYTSGGTYMSTDANGHPCVSFGAPIEGDDCGGRLKFSGLDFYSEATDWTVVAAVRLRDNSPTFPAYFIFGESDLDRKRLELGFRSPTRMTMTTGSQQLDALVAVPLDEFNVYTFRFSQTEGMSIFVNLDREPVAEDVLLTDHLQSFLRASLGSSNGTDLQIADLRAYGFATDPTQRLCMVKEMLNYYEGF